MTKLFKDDKKMHTLTDKDFATIWVELDINHDGLISLDEFLSKLNV